MNYSKLILADDRNGPGYRTTIFVSGCDKSPHCKSCFNKQAWDFECGTQFNNDTKEEILDNLNKHYIKGLSILGGDPISNVRKDDTLLDLVKEVSYYYPNKTIFVWTGFDFEDIIKEEKVRQFLQYVDMLRDGEYIESLKDITQYLEGSTNQRYIDVKNSLLKNKTLNYNF